VGLSREGREPQPARPHFSAPVGSFKPTGWPQTTMIGVVKPISSILASSEFEFIILLIIASPLGVQAMWC
jgi:hypothetical protein